MAIVSTPQTIRIAGSLTIEPSIPVVGGTESAAILSEAANMKAVVDQTFSLAAGASRTFTMSTVLGSSAAFVFYASTNRVTLVETAFGVSASGVFYVRKDSTNSIAEIQITNPGTSAVTVRLILGALA
jgi:hypothetical protein